MHDLPHKVHYSWFKDGTISSKGIYDDSGRGAGYEWDYFEGGKLSSYGKKSEGHVNDSVWSYYHRTGNLSFKAWWDKGIFVKGECFDENGQSQGACDTTTSMPDPGFDVNSFIGRNLIMPNDVKYDAINHYNCEVIVEFCVLEDGSVEVWNPHSTCFKSTEKEAVRVLRKMPKWKPARQHNRPVKVYYTIPISFRLI
ncbi:MAG: hypothetical protein EOP56_07145 [Sphingobacteriales bacterium]|nr:MAG: hypothetical protein EOP56_07145 [Sphingobacteriales bacterium]